MTQDGKGLLCCNFPLQIMLNMLDDSWCAETSFPKKTISSSLFGEYKYCWVILSCWIHILVIIFYVKTLHVLQNQSFSSLLLWVMLFLVTATCSLLLIMSLRWLLNFLFCVVSLLWTSRYVLIDISNLTHFLCCNLFVMFYLTFSVISANVLEIRLPITGIYPFTEG